MTFSTPLHLHATLYIRSTSPPVEPAKLLASVHHQPTKNYLTCWTNISSSSERKLKLTSTRLIERAHDVLTGRFDLISDRYLDEDSKLVHKEELISDLWEFIWKTAEYAKRPQQNS